MSGWRLDAHFAPAGEDVDGAVLVDAQEGPVGGRGLGQLLDLLAQRGQLLLGLLQGEGQLLVLRRGVGQLALGVEEALLEGLHATGALLEAAAERVDLVLGVGQLRPQCLGLGGQLVGVRGGAHFIHPSAVVGARNPHTPIGLVGQPLMRGDEASVAQLSCPPPPADGGRGVVRRGNAWLPGRPGGGGRRRAGRGGAGGRREGGQHGQCGHLGDRVGEVQGGGEVAGVGRRLGRVASGERLQAPAPLDELEHRRVVVEVVVDRGRLLVRGAVLGADLGADAGEGRHHHARHAEPGEHFALLVEVGVRATRRGAPEGHAGGDAARHHVVEEPAPFVVVDDEHGLVPARSRGDGMEDLRQEGVAGADVGQRVIVGRGPVGFAGELRIQVGHVGEVPGGHVAQERGERGGNREIRVSPEGDERHVAVVVATGRPARMIELVPNGGEGGLGERIVEAVGLRRVLEETVGIGRGQDGAEVAVAGRVGPGQPAHEGAVGGRVVADGEGVVGGVREEAVHLALVVLQAPSPVGVVGVGETAAVELGLVERGPGGALRVFVREARLPAVGVGQPPEEVVEAPVLHHHDDHVLDPGLGRRGEGGFGGSGASGGSGGPRRTRCSAPPAEEYGARGPQGTLDERPTVQCHEKAPLPLADPPPFRAPGTGVSTLGHTVLKRSGPGVQVPARIRAWNRVWNPYEPCGSGPTTNVELALRDVHDRGRETTT